MNILLVSSKYMPEYSGSGLRAHNLYKRILRKSQELNLTAVITGSETENDIKEYSYEGFTINRIACKKYEKLSKNPLIRRWQNWRNFHSEFCSTQKFLKNLKHKPGLIHIFGKSYVTAASLNYGIANSIPTLIELCNEMISPAFYVPFPSNIFAGIKPSEKYKYVCISERLKNVCLNNGVPEGKIWCRPNPVDEKKFYPVSSKEKIEIRRKITGWDESIKLLCYVAKLIPRKNHLFLLHVIEKLPDNYRLFIGGPSVESGVEFERDSALICEISKKLKEKKLEEKVKFLPGFFPNIDEIYKMSDVYMFPTKEEGLGTPLLEAVACGIPVVANRIKGISDVWIKDEKNGFVSDLNHEEFSEKIKLACEFSERQKLEESQKILTIAGTEAIDKKYIQTIKDLGSEGAT
ncbi:MAG TPA: glycosyltransferase family 4 protein [Victivallales bacterium]|nr:glycosyltransferase family 4 protein [Victivallales bacterium]